jgi:hypothetical protein
MDCPVDILLYNAGTIATRKITRAHGLEMQFATNHMGNFILSYHLMDQLREARQGQSKLANLLHAVALAKRLEGSGATANAADPGVVRTGLMVPYLSTPADIVEELHAGCRGEKILEVVATGRHCHETDIHQWATAARDDLQPDPRRVGLYSFPLRPILDEKPQVVVPDHEFFRRRQMPGKYNRARPLGLDQLVHQRAHPGEIRTNVAPAGCFSFESGEFPDPQLLAEQPPGFLNVVGDIGHLELLEQ